MTIINGVRFRNFGGPLYLGNYPNNYTEFEADGTLEANGDATTYDDWAVSASLAIQGQSSEPDYDFTNLGLLFPNNDTGEIAYIVSQMQHRKQMDSPIYYHVHYIQSAAAQPTFKLDYKFYNNGAAVPGSWTTISTGSGTGASKGIFTYPGSGSIMQIATFPAITPPTSETVSANIDVKFYRDDNDIEADVLVKYIDFHYVIDTQGSREEFSK